MAWGSAVPGAGMSAVRHDEREFIFSRGGPALLHRPRLTERLRSAAGGHVGAIIAAAGYGKSVALEHFLATEPEAILYEAGRDGATLFSFVRGLARALAARIAVVGSSLDGAIERAMGSEAPASALADWLAKHPAQCDGLDRYR